MANFTRLMGLHLETSMHAGAGTQLDVIDLPIQRELPTEYPVVFGSSLKGALRQYARETSIEGLEIVDLTTTLFGPENVNADTASAGDMLVGDARLLLLPVRSLCSPFKWVTCPYVLSRLKKDAERLGLTLNIQKITVTENQAITKSAGTIFLEENQFSCIENGALIVQLATLLNTFSAHDILEELKEKLVIVCDADFSYLSKNATPVNAHVKINNETKTTTSGALWYEETLPPETIMYAPIIINNQRGQYDGKNSDAFLSVVRSKKYIQIGGNETVGMGWCKLQLVGDA